MITTMLERHALYISEKMSSKASARKNGWCFFYLALSLWCQAPLNFYKLYKAGVYGARHHKIFINSNQTDE